jgi:hypothetical protein
MKMISLFTFAALAYSISTHAGSLQVAQWIPWSFVANEISRIPLQLNIQRQVLSLEWGELKPVINGLKISIDGSLSDLQITKDGIRGQSDDVMADINLASLSVDQVIIKEFNGNRISILLKANCSPLKVTVPQFSIKMNSTFVPDHMSWRPDLTNIDLLIPSNGWSFTPVTCTGIDGVGQEITDRVTQSLKDPTVISDLLKTWLSSQLQESWNQTWNNLVDAGGPKMKILFMERPTDKGMMIFAELPLTSKNVVGLGNINQINLSNYSPQLILSQLGFNALLEDQLIKLAPQKYNLNQVSGFAKLMKSRVIQYFVWPDLRRFNSKTPFLLTTQKDDATLLLRPRGIGKWLAQINAHGFLEVEMNSARIDYLQWGIGVDAEIQASVKDSILKISTGKAALNMAWNFGLLYKMLFNPKQRIAVDILQGALGQFFSNQSMEQELPVLHFENRKLKLQNWSSQNNFITMDWLEDGV